MVLRLEVNKAKNGLVYALLFFAAMNFQAKFFYFVFISFFTIVRFQRGFKANAASLIYFALGVLMALYNANEGILSMIRCFAPCSFYLVGLNIAAESSDPVACERETKVIEKQGYMVLLMIALGSFAHYFINYVYNFGNFLTRNTRDIWTGEVMAATGQSALACLMLGLAMATLFYPVRKWHRIAASLSIILILVYNLFLATRTLIVIALILLLIASLYFMANSKDVSRKIKYLFRFGVLAVLMIVAYGLNLGGIQDYLGNSIFFQRFGDSLQGFTSSSGRIEAKISFLLNALEHPFGGLHLRQQYGYAHDLLLDGYDEYGVLALILMVGVLITGAIQLYRILRYHTFSREFQLAALLMYAGVLLEFMVEPILAGMPWLFSCYCLMNGCLTSLNWRHLQCEEGAEV